MAFDGLAKPPRTRRGSGLPESREIGGASQGETGVRLCEKAR